MHILQKYTAPHHPKNKLVKKVSGIKTVEDLFFDPISVFQKEAKTEKEEPVKRLQSVLDIPPEIHLTIREIGQGKFLNFQTDRGTLNYK